MTAFYCVCYKWMYINKAVNKKYIKFLRSVYKKDGQKKELFKYENKRLF